ncbi:Glucose/arabinose dehydrogenase, beta-propeller fold [Shimia gijangensis]|uniref:Glucose/arabinose dehydrogenase, beta-propeller fold n=1 Tax=Shimia gijangensis TaxID=1470563 RepID=A0A1M6PUP0_9RHOB|nr:PQQ-dependent sugar dehydrogenase [Shimia gijangensis]SHK11658.1 Glucose/arabinose dehydrogenase, beta-propeller fold [Shimia gijangensis]
MILRLFVGLVLGVQLSIAQAQTLETSQGSARLEVMADGLATPWAIGFLPDGGFLISEREGRLWRVDDQGAKFRISGLPDIHSKGQGGLLDVMVPRDFAHSREVFFSFAKRLKGGTGTAVMRATLNAGSDRLTNQTVIFEMNTGVSGGRHYGSRIVEARDGTLFVTLGERADRDQAQNLASHKGKVIRITRDGAIPKNNPFLKTDGALPEIWSYGHRNPQGATLDRSGKLWVTEHGAKGGDEVNRIQKGANYGWPVISYGTHYSGFKIGDGTRKPGMQQPSHYWDPSIAPSGLLIYSGKLWPRWKGHFFVGSLKFDYISRLSGSTLTEKEQIKGRETARVRDIREAPDGSIWFIAEDGGRVFRMSPKN